MGINGAPLALITGAASGVGLAAARVLGAKSRLILTDINKDRLAAARASLEADGVQVAGVVVGPLQDMRIIEQLARVPSSACKIDVLVHSAGLSPIQADWRTSIVVNAIATRQLMSMVSSKMAYSGVAILLSSLAGHAPIPLTEADRILTEEDDAGLVDRLAPFIEALPESDRSGRAYVLSKRMILRLCEKLSVEWATRGVRVVSISPGVVDTPMGRLEAEKNPAAQEILAMVPLGGFVAPNDIAAAIAFLVSPAARFITGTDLKIDGGLHAVTVAARA